MSFDLRDQIRRYAEHVEAGQVPVSVTEINARIGDTDEVMVGFESSKRSRWVPRGPWPALAAAVLALVVFGLLVWVLPGRESVEPADSTVPSTETTLSTFVPGFSAASYSPTTVPNGFALFDIRTIVGSRLLYLAQTGDIWLPTDGGFAVDDVSTMLGSPGQALNIDDVLEAAPGSERVTVGGRPGAILETQLSQDDVTTSLIWVLGVDERGGVFEVSATGMGRDEVLAVADGVIRVPVEDFVDLGSEITWDVKIDFVSEGLSFQIPSDVVDVADTLRVAVGSDILWPRLSNAGQGTTVVTSDSGEVVDTGGQPIESYTAEVFLETSDENMDEILSTYLGAAELSPEQRNRRVDSYLAQVGVEQILSEDPYIIQAASGPEPRFDTSVLGAEIPLVPTQFASVVPSFILNGRDNDRAAATVDRPVVVVGTVGQPGTDQTSSLTQMIWFTETGTICEGAGIDGSLGYGCGFEILSQFGITGESTGGPSNDGAVTYAVSLNASVVQILTASDTFWQRPVAGYGLVPYGTTVDRPTTIVAYDVDGNEIGRWENPS